MESELPLVSLGLPVFNGQQYLREAIDSVLKQDYSNFELTISDNSSTDSTAEICKEYLEKDSRIAYFRQESNLGPVANFEFVRDRARGEYFAWVAADDYRSVDFLSSSVAILESDSSIACVMNDVTNVIEGSECDTIKLLSIRHESTDVRTWKKRRLLFFRNPTSDIFFCIYGLFRSEQLRDINLRPVRTGLLAAGEVSILAQVACLGKIVSTSSGGFYYRRHASSLYHVETAVTTPKIRVLHTLKISQNLLVIVLRSNLSRFSKLRTISTIGSSFSEYLSPGIRKVRKMF